MRGVGSLYAGLVVLVAVASLAVVVATAAQASLKAIHEQQMLYEKARMIAEKAIVYGTVVELPEPADVILVDPNGVPHIARSVVRLELPWTPSKAFVVVHGERRAAGADPAVRAAVASAAVNPTSSSNATVSATMPTVQCSRYLDPFLYNFLVSKGYIQPDHYPEELLGYVYRGSSTFTIIVGFYRIPPTLRPVSLCTQAWSGTFDRILGPPPPMQVLSIVGITPRSCPSMNTLIVFNLPDEKFAIAIRYYPSTAIYVVYGNGSVRLVSGKNITINNVFVTIGSLWRRTELNLTGSFYSILLTAVHPMASYEDAQIHVIVETLWLSIFNTNVYELWSSGLKPPQSLLLKEYPLLNLDAIISHRAASTLTVWGYASLINTTAYFFERCG